MQQPKFSEEAEAQKVLSNAFGALNDIAPSNMQPASSKSQMRLWLACHDNNLPLAQKILGQGVSPEFYHYGQRPLVTACQNGSEEIIRLLLDHGADVNIPTIQGFAH